MPVQTVVPPVIRIARIELVPTLHAVPTSSNAVPDRPGHGPLQ